jgi:hypothetical protein
MSSSNQVDEGICHLFVSNFSEWEIKGPVARLVKPGGEGSNFGQARNVLRSLILEGYRCQPSNIQTSSGSVSVVIRYSSEFRQRLPMPWMGTASARTDVGGVRQGDTQRCRY